MAIPYQRTFYASVSDADVVVPVDFATKAFITRLRIVRLAVEASLSLSVSEAPDDLFTLDIYNRAFTAAAVNIDTITQRDAFCLIKFQADHRLAVGDTIAVVGTGGGAYGGMHVVTAVLDRFHVVTNVHFTINGYGGIATLTIPIEEYPVYEVMAQQTSGADGVLRWQASYGIAWVNEDAEGDAGKLRKLYLKFSLAGRYKVSITGITEYMHA